MFLFAELNMFNFFSPAIFKVIYADDLHAVTYECERKSRDGHCSQHAEHLEILSRREGERLSEELLEELAPHLRRACKEKEDVKATVKEGNSYSIPCW